jgi:CHAT domain-containing protein
MNPISISEPSLSSRAMLCSLSISMWSARKHDPEASEEINQRHGAQADAGRYHKVLLPKEALAEIHKIVGEARQEHYFMTLPWDDNGYRVLPAAAYTDHTEKMRALSNRFTPGVEALVHQFGQLVEEAKGRLGGLFRPGDYPAPDELRSKFSFETKVMPLPDAGDFRVALGDEEKDRIKRQITAAVEASLRPAPTDPITDDARKEVNRVQLALLHEANSSQRANLLERLFQAEQVLAPVGTPKSTLQQAAIRAQPVGLVTLQQSLRPDEMILEYVLDELSSYCLHITHTSAAVTVLPAARKPIEHLVETYVADVRLKKSNAETGKDLYSLLVRPIPGIESKSRLIIVPDGKLHLLPFSSLPDSQGRYLLESHIVTYAPSATVLYLIRNSPMAQPPTQAFLGVGDIQLTQDRTTAAKKDSGTASASTTTPANPFDLGGTRLQDIPATRDEVIAVSQLFGEKTLLLGMDATETAFKAEPLAEFEIIHIAAHGVASAKFPDRAALVLGNDPKSGEDGLLQVREIRDLSLNADLVTLSACDTGVGALEGEEGIANLVRAFLFAGAKSVVASLWAASDVYTLKLMQHFYRHIADGEDKASALRHAQMELIKEFVDEAKPFYWAGFIMVGDGSRSILISPDRVHRGHSPQ